MSVNDYPTLEAFADSMDRMKRLEVDYEGMILAAKENWPPSSMTIIELREQEFLIDSERSQQGLPLRFHTAEQLAILMEPDRENQTDEGCYYARCSVLERHYLPSSAIETLREPPPVEKGQKVVVGGRTTLTLGALIQELQELQKTLGNNVPVWHTQMGGVTGTHRCQQWNKGVVIE